MVMDRAALWERSGPLADSVGTELRLPALVQHDELLDLVLSFGGPLDAATKLVASSSQFNFLVTKMRTEPEEVNSTSRRVSQPHLSVALCSISTIWVTSSLA
ncbi:hypothetical protein EYF80_059764 [Liparis tanakae]|uniref:Uncharacterized protein n=1 Tax=Liparis tanakae TaxID=230148 RepID=A0A4Z2EMH4_9TELE|nr:hypothetical protein EYF80_059764 [Liparis tanakae]